MRLRQGKFGNTTKFKAKNVDFFQPAIVKQCYYLKIEPDPSPSRAEAWKPLTNAHL
jgi:hypothetical protein